MPLKNPPLTFQGEVFSAGYDPKKPWLLTLKFQGETLTLPALGGVHPSNVWDGLARPRLISSRETETGVVWVFSARSTIWKSFRTVWTFADRTDILRLNDLFDDREDIRPMMRHRAQMARIANENWLIDTDGDPFISAKAWWDYTKLQPELGLPSLMTITGMTRSFEDLSPIRLKALRKLWKQFAP